jgi:hypothetical protein
MPTSSRLINYRLRPAKSIERKMLCEAFRRLSVFGSTETFRYLGFGSFYFADFLLLHKELGITNMISIEKDVQNIERYEFNKPYKTIRIMQGESNQVLLGLPWDMRTIMWLDYDGRLEKSVLQDVETFCMRAHPASVLIVSVNAQAEDFDPDKKNQEVGEIRLAQLKERLGEENVPARIKGTDLSGWGMARVCRDIIRNEIEQTITARNGGRAPGTKFTFQQLFNFHYSDGARMLTVGGILLDEGQKALFDGCALKDLFYVRMGDDPFRIEVPNLTPREVRYLNSNLPSENLVDIERHGMTAGDLEKYASLYRYYPFYTESNE